MAGRTGDGWTGDGWTGSGRHDRTETKSFGNHAGRRAPAPPEAGLPGRMETIGRRGPRDTPPCPSVPGERVHETRDAAASMNSRLRASAIGQRPARGGLKAGSYAARYSPMSASNRASLSSQA